MNTTRLSQPRASQAPAFRRTCLASACGILLAGVSPAHAQAAAAAAPATAASAPVNGQAAVSDDTGPQRVVVQGIRKSVDTSINLKREAHGVVDGIVAEDIGKFPDSNLAEAMQRISGVSIDRVAGEGSKVTVRGVGPDFNQVLLNGRQMPASTVMDTGPSNSRAFDFANLASESISAMEVYKTSRASSPTGGIGATINIRTARPLENPGLNASIGMKLVSDTSNQSLPDNLKGKDQTPEFSGIYSNTFLDNTVGIALTGSRQVRDSGYNQVAVSNGWRTFHGDENTWGTIPQNGQPGSENIINRPGPNDIYSVPQNINYGLNAIHRERTNGQLTLQFAPVKAFTATLDHTYSQNKLDTKRNDLSAWFNFGPSASSWTNGPVAGPVFYSEFIDNKTAPADVAMGGAMFGVKTTLNSTGLNLAWKPSDHFKLGLDAHHSVSESGKDSPYGTNAVLGTAAYNRGTTTVDFSKPMPVLMIADTALDASLQQVTGSSFRNSYMKSGVDQEQLSGSWKLPDESSVDFGLGLTRVSNRSAYSNVQRDTWGGATSPADYPDTVWHPDILSRYFGRMDGHDDPRLFNQFFTWDFATVRDLAAAAAGNDALYRASDVFSTDRRTKEDSKNFYVQYNRDWEWGVPMSLNAGLRYERTDVTSSALVPTPSVISWGSNNELSVLYGGDSTFTTLKGGYKYWLPSVDFDAELTSRVKVRVSYGESIGRPGWGDIQGGQTLDTLVRVDGGTGAQGNPNLRPLLSHNTDASVEYYYAKSSYVAVGFFNKAIDNYIGTTQVVEQPFNLNTPISGDLYNQALANGGCVAGDNTCIRNYIFRTFDGTHGVTRGPDDAQGNATGTIVGQPGDPVANFRITEPANAHSAKLHGFEFNIQHSFGNTGLGLGANYTLVVSGLKYNNAVIGEQFALVGLSNSANVVGFYEDDHWNARLAYNWRGQFLAALADGAGANPVYTEPYGQLDMTLGYHFTPNASIELDGLNLGNSIQRQHSRTKNELESITQTGTVYMLGFRYKF